MDLDPVTRKVSRLVGYQAKWRHGVLTCRLDLNAKRIRVVMEGFAKSPWPDVPAPGEKIVYERAVESLEEAKQIAQGLPEFGPDEAHGLGFIETEYICYN